MLENQIKLKLKLRVTKEEKYNQKFAQIDDKIVHLQCSKIHAPPVSFPNDLPAIDANQFSSRTECKGRQPRREMKISESSVGLNMPLYICIFVSVCVGHTVCPGAE